MPFHRYPYLLTVAALIAAAIYTFCLRESYIGTLGHSRHQWLTASTLKFTENWRIDGIFNDYGLMLEYPKTIERQTIEAREPYLSYLPGAPLAIYALMQLWPDSSILALIHVFNMLNQYAIATLLALIVWHGAPATAAAYRPVLAALAGLTYMLHPEIMYWHSMVFFSDQAVLLPFALVLFLELRIRKIPATRHKLQYAQALLLLIAACIDWFAVTVAATLCLFRLLSPLQNTAKRSFFTSLPWLLSGPLAAIALWAAHVYAFGDRDEILLNFATRAAADTPNPLARLAHAFLEEFLYDHLFAADTAMLLIALAASLYTYYRRDRHNPALCVTLIAFAACFAHTFIFLQHTENHQFAVMKFYLPLAFAAYGLLPAFLIPYAAGHAATPAEHRNNAFLLVLSAALLWGWIMIPAHREWRQGFPDPRLYHRPLLDFIRDKARFETVLISKDIHIAHQPPQAIAIARRPVYSFESMMQLERFMRSAPAGAEFYGIIRAKLAKQCGADADTAAKVKSQREYWLFVRLDAGSDVRLKRCLTQNGK